MPQKDLPRGCPDCALTEAYENFRADCEAQIERRFGVSAQYSTESLIAYLRGVRSALASSRGKIVGSWSVKLGELAKILKSEQDRARYIDDWNSRKKKRD